MRTRVQHIFFITTRTLCVTSTFFIPTRFLHSSRGNIERQIKLNRGFFSLFSGYNFLCRESFQVILWDVVARLYMSLEKSEREREIIIMSLFIKYNLPGALSRHSNFIPQSFPFSEREKFSFLPHFGVQQHEFKLMI